MCGIAGVVTPRGEQPGRAQLEAMLAQLAHRGPDGDGVYLSGRLGLGHRRLAVLDPGATGHQPMSYDGGRLVIVFNGEIYNFLELRTALSGFGYRFSTDTDTEVILAAFSHWGERCQEHFNGMWAFAIWDRERELLFLSRDRFGVKPLYYYSRGGRFAFSSELKGLLPLPWLVFRFAEGAVALAIAQPAALETTEDCLLEGVKRLLPGHCMTVDSDGGISVRRWWQTGDHLADVPLTFAGQVREFRRLFFDAVRLRLRSDVPIGCTLSGGLDSSSVACTMARIRQAGKSVERNAPAAPLAFVASYPDSSHDEASLALSVARYVGLETVTVQVDPSVTSAVFDQFIFRTEEVQSPHVGPWLLYRAMRDRGIRVSLDGHGGDELLAGYIDHVRHARDAALTGVPRLGKAARLTAILRGMATGVYRAPRIAALLEEGGRWYRRRGDRGRRSSLSERQPAEISPIELLGGDVRERLLGRERQDTSGGDHTLTRLLYDDFHVRSLPTILRDFDRYSMASGVEVRSPFLDWRLVCFCLALPPRAVLGGGFTKRILRTAMQGIVPDEARLRMRKIPYKSPFAEWWGGGLRELVLDTVNSAAFLAVSAWDGAGVRRLVEATPDGERFEHALVVLRFVVAHRLMELFAQARARCLVEFC